MIKSSTDSSFNLSRNYILEIITATGIFCTQQWEITFFLRVLNFFRICVHDMTSCYSFVEANGTTTQHGHYTSHDSHQMQILTIML